MFTRLLCPAMLHRLFQVLLICCSLTGLTGWIVSPEMAENWAFARAGTADSLLDAQALLWIARVGAPAVAIATWWALRRWPRTERTVRRLCSEFLTATRNDQQQTNGAAVRSGVVRVLIAAWLLLAAVKWGDGARRVVHEWPIYRWTSGDRVLPNMSESNRDVIRYLREATPEDARILGVSDQTLFFLAYYLWPREVLHHRHPESEFVVPQPGQARQLAAYRLSDLTAEQLSQMRPDYVLEYFEGPEYVEPSRVLDDRRWVSFARQLHGDPSYTPAYNVRLRRIDELQGAP